MNELLEFLTDKPTSLESLSLVQMSIPSKTMPLIVNFLEDNVILEELDLSWNSFAPADFVLLMESLSKNNILRVINLSWNLMIPSKLQKGRSDFRYPHKNDKSV